MDPAADRALREVEERGVRLVRLWFSDVLGFLKSFAVPSEELQKAFAEGIGFDGSAIEGFARAEEEDMLARPDPTTLRLLPWPADEPVARMLCDITHPDGAPFAGDPRSVLRRNLARAAELGYAVRAGPEVEYFLSRSAERLDPLDRGGYFDLTPAEAADDVRRQTLAALERLDVRVESMHHEDAPSQHEVVLAAGDALAVADAILTARLAVKEVAQEAGLHASFMPKPAAGIQGSGMHTHFQLLEGERNAFFDPTAEARLSKVGRSFVAGLLEHAPAMTAVTNQWVNSYKRLVPGYEAPVYVCWGRRNRSALVRVPADRPDDESACRIEYRAPDPACNPYLAFSVILAAGLDGIARELEPPAEATDNLQAMSEEERRAMGIRSLPDNLHDAVALMERSDLVAEALGEHVFEWFIRNKREEWAEYRSYVTPWEVERSFPLL
ncbi:MAG TPA: glutamine synthetase family protein [Actinomycetota bacterium]|nr:glutamine synthetase family protein [Actinomycetota bacterium]